MEFKYGVEVNGVVALENRFDEMVDAVACAERLGGTVCRWSRFLGKWLRTVS